MNDAYKYSIKEQGYLCEVALFFYIWNAFVDVLFCSYFYKCIQIECKGRVYQYLKQYLRLGILVLCLRLE